MIVMFVPAACAAIHSLNIIKKEKGAAYSALFSPLPQLSFCALRAACPRPFLQSGPLYGIIRNKKIEKGEIALYYVTGILFTLAAWFIGLLLDANIDFGDPAGFLCLRVLLPILAMGLYLLKVIREHTNKHE